MSEKKKVLIFCGGTRVFGAEIVTLSIIKALKESGYELFCITSAWNDGHFHNRLEESGIPYQPVKLGFIYLTKLLWTLDSLIYFPGAISAINTIIKNFQPDLIYHTSYTSLLMTYPVLKKRKNLFFVFDPYYGKMNRFYFNLLNKIVHTYVAVSNAIRSNLTEIGATAEKILVLKNGIDVNLSIPATEPKAVIHFGMIGQIMPRKGHDDVIEALKILKSENILFKCVIIGSGNADFIHHLKEKIVSYDLQNDVIWVDFIKNRDEIYQLFDIVLVPSTTLDPLPTVAMEAGLYYKPCIVTDIGGLPEIVIDQITGFILTVQSPSELAERMKFLIRDRNRIKSMGKAAHDHIIKNFDVKIQVKQLHPIIDH